MNGVDLLKFVQENIVLIAVAFVSGGMLLWPALRRGAAGPTVNTLEATILINQRDALLLDVRDASDYRQGHILAARNVPLAQLEARVSDLSKYKERPVIISCQSGNVSAKAAAVMRRHGFTQVFNLAGGIAAWQQAGLPVEK